MWTGNLFIFVVLLMVQLSVGIEDVRGPLFGSFNCNAEICSQGGVRFSMKAKFVQSTEDVALDIPDESNVTVCCDESERTDQYKIQISWICSVLSSKKHVKNSLKPKRIASSEEQIAPKAFDKLISIKQRTSLMFSRPRNTSSEDLQSVIGLDKSDIEQVTSIPYSQQPNDTSTDHTHPAESVRNNMSPISVPTTPKVSTDSVSEQETVLTSTTDVSFDTTTVFSTESTTDFSVSTESHFDSSTVSVTVDSSTIAETQSDTFYTGSTEAFSFPSVVTDGENVFTTPTEVLWGSSTTSRLNPETDLTSSASPLDSSTAFTTERETVFSHPLNILAVSQTASETDSERHIDGGCDFPSDFRAEVKTDFKSPTETSETTQTHETVFTEPTESSTTSTTDSGSDDDKPSTEQISKLSETSTIVTFTPTVQFLLSTSSLSDEYTQSTSTMPSDGPVTITDAIESTISEATTSTSISSVTSTVPFSDSTTEGVTSDEISTTPLSNWKSLTSAITESVIDQESSSESPMEGFSGESSRAVVNDGNHVPYNDVDDSAVRSSTPEEDFVMKSDIDGSSGDSILQHPKNETLYMKDLSIISSAEKIASSRACEDDTCTICTGPSVSSARSDEDDLFTNYLTLTLTRTATDFHISEVSLLLYQQPLSSKALFQKIVFKNLALFPGGLGATHTCDDVIELQINNTTYLQITDVKLAAFMPPRRHCRYPEEKVDCKSVADKDASAIEFCHNAEILMITIGAIFAVLVLVGFALYVSRVYCQSRRDQSAGDALP